MTNHNFGTRSFFFGQNNSLNLPVRPNEAMETIAMPNVPLPFEDTPLPSPSTWLNEPWSNTIDLKTPRLEDFNAALGMQDALSAEMPSAGEATSLSNLPPLLTQGQSLGSASLTQDANHLGRSHDMPISALTSQSAMEHARDVAATQSLFDMSRKYGAFPGQPDANLGTIDQPRHSRTRTQSVSTGHSAAEESTDEKRRLSRERNRLAAAKTRRKKKSKAKEIEENAKTVVERNRELHQEVRNLRDTFSTLRDCALAHNPTIGCTCGKIHQYNEAMAQEVAKEVAKAAF
jgi:hypothetical protein